MRLWEERTSGLRSWCFFYFKLARSFFVLLIFFSKICIFLCQNFGISKNCTIFVIQSNTE